jgi:hypothetical protein
MTKLLTDILAEVAIDPAHPRPSELAVAREVEHAFVMAAAGDRSVASLTSAVANKRERARLGRDLALETLDTKEAWTRSATQAMNRLRALRHLGKQTAELRPKATKPGTLLTLEGQHGAQEGGRLGVRRTGTSG